MKNQISIFVGSDEYLVQQIFDTEYGDGVDIFQSDPMKHIGTLYDISIPELDSEENELTEFENIIISYIEEL